MANELPSRKDEPRADAAIGNTQLLERVVLLLLFAGLLLGILAVLRPFTTAILFGAILAIAGWPLRDFLLRHGLKRGLAATLLLLLALALVALPMMAVAPDLAEHLTQGARRLQDYFASAPQVPSWLAGLPIVGDRLARLWNQAMLTEGGIRGARRERPADHPVVGRSGAVLGQRRRPGGEAARLPPAALRRDRRCHAGRRGGRGARCGLRGGRDGRHPGRRNGDRLGRGGGSGRRPARLCHPAACAQPDRRAADRGSLGWRRGLAVWSGPAGLGHFPDHLGPRRHDDGQCHQALVDRLWRGDADEPDDPGRVRRFRRVRLPRPVHWADTDRRRVHATRGLARSARDDAGGGRAVTRRSASPTMVRLGVACAAGIRERERWGNARFGSRRWAGSPQSFLW